MSGSQSVNPYTGEDIAFYAWQAEAEVDACIALADCAFATWRRTSVSQRCEVLAQLAHALRHRAGSLARLIALEMGKPLTQALAEVEKCAVLCDWYATNTERLLADEYPELGKDGSARISYEPLGVVLGVMPWNFPLWQVLRAAVPVLAAGNGFLLKHADNVQGCALALVKVIAETDAPAGLFGNLHIHHSDLPRLIADARIVGVSVTAGTAAGAAIAAEAGRNLKRSVLELGGSDPFIVLADADLEKVVPAAIEARFQNCGQVCIAAKRFIIEDALADTFIDRFVAATAKLKLGDPLALDTQLGPLARLRQRDELIGQIERSKALGARLLLGGSTPPGNGAFLQPTVLTGITPDMPVFREEIFGPVAPIVVATDADHAAALANLSEFGLCGSIWTSDIAAGERLARKIRTGGIFINKIAASDPRVPIGGIGKSGYGRELSHFGLREFCNVKLTWSPTHTG